MPKKLFSGLVPVLAIAAFAAVPAAAQAACVSTKGEKECPHYYVNGARLKAGTASTKTNIAWGTITLTGTEGAILGAHVTCRTVQAGTVLNPEPLEKSAGEGLVQQYAGFACEQTLVCPSKSTAVTLKGANLPWRNVLTEEVAGTIRQETTGIKLHIECFEGTLLIGEFNFEAVAAEKKGPRPKFLEGTEALHPGLLEYGAGAGEFEDPSCHCRAKPEGTYKLLGYNAQELIAMKNP